MLGLFEKLQGQSDQKTMEEDEVVEIVRWNWILKTVLRTLDFIPKIMWNNLKDFYF